MTCTLYLMTYDLWPIDYWSCYQTFYTTTSTSVVIINFMSNGMINVYIHIVNNLTSLPLYEKIISSLEKFGNFYIHEHVCITQQSGFSGRHLNLSSITITQDLKDKTQSSTRKCSSNPLVRCYSAMSASLFSVISNELLK